MLDDKVTLLVGYEREVSPSRRRPEDGIRERDLQRIEVLSKVLDGRTTIVSAAHVLALSTRQVGRVLPHAAKKGGTGSAFGAVLTEEEEDFRQHFKLHSVQKAA